MRCPKCGREQADDGLLECGACGLVFARLHPREKPRPRLSPPRDGSRAPTLRRLLDLVLAVAPDVEAPVFYGRLFTYLLFLVWGLGFVVVPFEREDLASSFLHSIHLVFHEAGHVLLMPFGWDFLISLGGTLGQLAVPLICLVALLIRTRDPFGASLCLWWLGHSFLDIAPYIADARATEGECPRPMLGTLLTSRRMRWCLP